MEINEAAKLVFIMAFLVFFCLFVVSQRSQIRRFSNLPCKIATIHC